MWTLICLGFLAGWKTPSILCEPYGADLLLHGPSVAANGDIEACAEEVIFAVMTVSVFTVFLTPDVIYAAVMFYVRWKQQRGFGIQDSQSRRLKDPGRRITKVYNKLFGGILVIGFGNFRQALRVVSRVDEVFRQIVSAVEIHGLENI
ncbi:hypothetical protein BDR07DRAFT_1383488 [Suillus spraguei]|nr:hypothetical protein BDR07DRAFT_1383488 [Suillus spraguei]